MPSRVARDSYPVELPDLEVLKCLARLYWRVYSL